MLSTDSLLIYTWEKRWDSLENQAAEKQWQPFQSCGYTRNPLAFLQEERYCITKKMFSHSQKGG